MPLLTGTPDPVLRQDRFYLDMSDASRMTRLDDPSRDWKPDGPVSWCIYGDPSSPAYWDETQRVLWSTCRHPTDLSDGASARHHAAYTGRSS